MSEAFPDRRPRATDRSSLNGILGSRTGGPEALLLGALNATNTRPSEFQDYTLLEYRRSEGSWLDASLRDSRPASGPIGWSLRALFRRRGRSIDRHGRPVQPRGISDPAPTDPPPAEPGTVSGSPHPPGPSAKSDSETAATLSYGTGALARLTDAAGGL